ncbi:hypothetical protein DSL72_001073 [Monilinia vaccinii-corymbosi]|uniref:UBC core domain-containing protein n=1 Tax=Monilinia vaccinii-corymbosi TaxID=61207 RepID=A0A8A3P6V7_9HELO|nr:hypothetical protein DSL72_001073 [Monilinia vaccinii-corymbosi]
MSQNLTLLRRRLLLDIAELQTEPYPNIALHVDDANLDSACLILDVDGYGPLHITIKFPVDYPLQPPTIEMNSDISHPNIHGGYICTSLLNTKEGWTPAYTLKGFAIQLLSFFASDALDQDDGSERVNLRPYREGSGTEKKGEKFICEKCSAKEKEVSEDSAVAIPDGSLRADLKKLDLQDAVPRSSKKHSEGCIQRIRLPDELMLLICEELKTEELILFARAWSRVSRMIADYDLIRTRELICFLTKQDYKTTQLGVGVCVDVKDKRQGTFSSEFDLISYEAYWDHRVRRSVQGIRFRYWLPLPISEEHWGRIKLEKESVHAHLTFIGVAARLGYDFQPFRVIYHFMNDVLVKLNTEAEGNISMAPDAPRKEIVESTLTYASEKAIESYFNLFHLLICLAVDDDSIVKSANAMLEEFINGQISESSCPNLGHLLVASLISDIELSDEAMLTIITETITRNVAWMFDRQLGKNMAGLSYMEPSEVSPYRLEKTFEAGKTSYRVLMFLNLFRRAALGNPRKPLSQLAGEAFQRHGAPPRGSAKVLADCIKRIHLIDSFPGFFKSMGMKVPGDAWFTHLLRRCIRNSIDKGYSKMPITQSQALYLRQLDEPYVEVLNGLQPVFIDICDVESFFPEKRR